MKDLTREQLQEILDETVQVLLNEDLTEYEVKTICQLVHTINKTNKRKQENGRLK